MDPEMSPDVLQMLTALGAQGQGPSQLPDMAQTGFGGVPPGFVEQLPSMGNSTIPLVPPTVGAGGGGMSDIAGASAGQGLAGPPPPDQNGWGGMPPNVAEMVDSLRGGGGGPPDMGGGPPQEGLDPGNSPVPDGGLAGPWTPGIGQVPELGKPQSPGNGNPFALPGQGNQNRQ